MRKIPLRTIVIYNLQKDFVDLYLWEITRKCAFLQFTRKQKIPLRWKPYTAPAEIVVTEEKKFHDILDFYKILIWRKVLQNFLL